MKKHPSLTTLPKKELVKILVLTKEEIEEALRKGWEEVKGTYQ